ncbi:MAG: VWA domain-containing protein [Bacteroidetes bacterium]|nr:VWA domain-containing protein [Bacteroidota bacterium]
MLQFAHITYLWLLVIVPLSILIYLIWYQKKKAILNQLADKRITNILLPNRNPKKTHLKFGLYILSLICFIIALAQPQLGTKQEKIKRKGIDVVIALDLSNSMLAQDIAPNRLQKSKLFIQELIKKLDGDRVGLVIFAGKAYTQMPLTVDYSSMLMYLRSVNMNSIPIQGTALAEALGQSETLFDKKDKKHKAVILITDGEDHEENAIDLAEELASTGVKITTIGAGTKQGGKIPITDAQGNIIDYKKDAEGNEINTALNENMMQALAKAGKGNYYILDNTKTVADLVSNDISKIETKTINEKVFTNFVEQFQYFLLIGLIFLLINLFIDYRK